MKIRCGFVSNSSSSSYAIIGGAIEYDVSLLAYLQIPYTGDGYSIEWDSDLWNEALTRLALFYLPFNISVINCSQMEYIIIGYDLENPAIHDITINQLKQSAKHIFSHTPKAITPPVIELDVFSI